MGQHSPKKQRGEAARTIPCRKMKGYKEHKRPGSDCKRQKSKGKGTLGPKRSARKLPITIKRAVKRKITALVDNIKPVDNPQSRKHAETEASPRKKETHQGCQLKIGKGADTQPLPAAEGGTPCMMAKEGRH